MADDHTSSDPDRDFAFAVRTSAHSLPSGTWLADSAATKHVIQSRSNFSSYTETPDHRIEGLGTCSSPGRGNVVISSQINSKSYSITLKNALHAPDSPYNLISIGCMTKAGYTLSLKDDQMRIYSPGPNSCEILRGQHIGELYKLFVTPIPNPSPHSPSKTAESPDIAFPVNSKAHSWDKWHRIFGHIHHGSVKMLKEKGMVTGMIIDNSSEPPPQCETCIKAKSHAMPFPPKSDTKYTEISEMTFTDVWGPSCIKGIHGEWYYISFTDAATRRTIVYFMKSRSEVIQKIQYYVQYILVQKRKHVKCFHCDNGKEYISAEVWRFLAEQGI